MADEGRETIPLESDKYKSDPVVNQHIMQMIDSNMHWYEQTFREIIMELQKIRNGEIPTKTSKESNETAMMCWESLDDSEQASKKRKRHAQDDETNDKDDEMDDKTPTVPKRTTNMAKHDRIPSTTPGAEPPRDARDSGSARSHSTHLETSSSNRP